MNRVELNCWGPYRDSVEERLLACDDFLGRLRCSIAGDVAPDRHYFAEKAHDLRDAAEMLVDHVDDVEWWLGACGHEVAEAAAVDGDLVGVGECGLVAGHEGEHLEESRCPHQRLLGDSRSVSRAYRLLADRLAWGLLTLRAGAGVTSPQALAVELRALQRRLGALASSVERLAAEAGGFEENG